VQVEPLRFTAGHHGAIRIQSAPGRGSVFEVLIPTASVSNEGEPKKEAEPSARELCGEGTILVIDDEEIVRKSAKTALERYSYEVLLANHGLEGVRISKIQAENYRRPAGYDNARDGKGRGVAGIARHLAIDARDWIERI
jgi:hypothetical protein